jgi:HSP20 family protein
VFLEKVACLLVVDKGSLKGGFLMKSVRNEMFLLLALSVGLSLGSGLFAVAHADDKSESGGTSQGVPVHVEKGHANSSAKGFDLDASINKMRSSAPGLSLPSTLFEPWWQTMMRDPDSDWLLSNFDIMSSNPGKKWIFPLGSGAYIPRVDIDASGETVKLSAEVPGIDEKNLDVTVNDDSVRIKGEKHGEEAQKASKGFQSVERHYGAFERSIVLPCKVDSDKAEAKLKNGVLTVEVPKVPNEKNEGKKLTIKRE